jgi:hypothetical protein
MSMRGSHLAFLIPSLFLVPACGKSDCEHIYEKETQCNPNKGKRKKDKDSKKSKDDDDDDDDDKVPGKDEFVAACKVMLSSSKAKKELEDRIECSRKDSCEEYETCRQAAQGKKRAGRITKELEDGKVKDAFSTCSWNPEYFSDDAYKNACKEVFAAVEKVKDPDDLRRVQHQCSGPSYEKMVKAYPDFTKTCQKLASTSYEKLLTKVIEARDTGKRDYSSCHSLEEAAKTMDGGKEGATTAKAKVACAKMNAAESVSRGIAVAKENVKAKKSMMPYQCSSTVEDVAKIDSEWAKKTKEELLKACYVDLGMVILEVEGGKDMKYYCPFGIKELVTAAEKYDLATKHAELGEALKKLPETCHKES